MAAAANKVLRVVLVDDSTLARVAFRRLLSGIESVMVIAEARNGEEALKVVSRQRPDIVVMDVMMPRMNGLEATKQIMSTTPVPILLISDLVGAKSELNFQSLRAGALELMQKPTADELSSTGYAQKLGRRLKLLAGVPLVTRRRSEETRPSPSSAAEVMSRDAAPKAGRVDFVAIGASTGGPPALQRLLMAMPTAPWPTLVVQHMSDGFTPGLVKWLAHTTKKKCQMVEHTTSLESGTVYFAPDGAHLVASRVACRLLPRDGRRPHCPSVDVLFESIAASGVADRAVGILLTGMGRDGAEGLRALRNAGAWTIAQDKATSVVYGMPAAAVQLEAACESLSLEDISLRLTSWTAFAGMGVKGAS